jgi:hypothetical protein
VRVLFRWLDEQFAVELAEMLSEEVEAKLEAFVALRKSAW